MAKIILDDVASGYNLNKINVNFDKIEAALNNQVLYRDNPKGTINTIKNDLDLDGNDLLNVGYLTIDNLDVKGTATLNGINFDSINSALIWRGTWNSATSYGISDGVSYNGSSFIALVPNTNVTPVEGVTWGLLAEKGDLGPAAGSADLISYLPAGTGAVATTVQDKLRERVSVLDFEADPTGQTDSTAAFQKAFNHAATTSSSSAGPISTNLSVFVPAGLYYIAGTVDIGKRIGFFGEGVNTVITGLSPASASPSTCGFRFRAPATTGIAPHIHDLTFFGFNSGPVMDIQTSGAVVESCFFSNAISGIDLNQNAGYTPASDILISNCIFDQMLSDVRAYSTVNTSILNCISFLTSFGVQFLGVNKGNSDVLISGCQFDYPRTSAVTVDSILNKNVQVDNCSFMLNAQHASFVGFIYTGPSTASTEIFVSNCRFRNWKDFAIRFYGSNYYSVIGCVFDATKTAADYAQSAASKAIAFTGCTLEVSIQNCQFRNVQNVLVDAYSSSVVKLVGGMAVNSPAIFGNDTSCTLTPYGFVSNDGRTLFGVQADYGRPLQVKGPIQFGDSVTGASTGIVAYANGLEAGLLCYDATPFWFWTALGKRLGLDSSGHTVPGADNLYNLGAPGARWGTVYAATGAINTSDKRTKQDVLPLSDAEKRVAVSLRGLIKKYRFKDAVQAKGVNARIHVGVVAQEVVAAFQAEGLDPMRYGIVCFDQWGSSADVQAGDRYGIRYEELLAFIISAL